MAKNKFFYRILLLIPRWTASGIVAGTILLLTLMPGDDMPQVELFPHFDKIVHAIMFGGLAATLIWDILRGRGKHRTVAVWLWAAVSATAFGGIVEVLQDMMGLGRSGDEMDLLADMAGAFILSAISIPVIKNLLKKAI